MRTRLYSEGKSIPSGERWFVRTYAVPVFRDYGFKGLKRFRLVQVRTIMEMEFANKGGQS